MLNLGRWLRSCGDRSLSGPRALWWSGKLSSRGARLPLFQSAPLYLLYYSCHGQNLLELRVVSQFPVSGPVGPEA